VAPEDAPDAGERGNVERGRPGSRRDAADGRAVPAGRIVHKDGPTPSGAMTCVAEDGTG
jgi:hypothetical protein